MSFERQVVHVHLSALRTQIFLPFGSVRQAWLGVGIRWADPTEWRKVGYSLVSLENSRVGYPSGCLQALPIGHVWVFVKQANP